KTIIEDVFHGRIREGDVPAQKRQLETVIREVMGGDVIARLESTGAGEMTELEHMIRVSIEAVTRHVSRRIEEDLVPLSIALYEESSHLDDRMAKLEGQKSEEAIKRAEEIKEQQSIIRKAAFQLKGVAAAEFRAEETAEKHILFLKGMLLPSEVKNLIEEKRVAAIVTAEAGPTTHWVLAAKGLNVPVFFVTRKAGGRLFELSMDDVLRDVRIPEDQVLLDGSLGSLIVAHDMQMVRDHDDKTKRISALGKYYDEIQKEPVREAEPGREAVVFANVDDKDSLLSALSGGADGAGLIRTELWLKKEQPFLKTFLSDVRDREERARAAAELKNYLKGHVEDLIKHSEGKPLTFRMFDVAEDKKEIGGYTAGAYGIDFYRTLEGYRLLGVELEAVYEAVASTGADNVRIMFPAVNTGKDMKDVRDWAREAIGRLAPADQGEEIRERLKNIPVGAMIETKEAVKNINNIMGMSDFISIGSNDLTRDIFRHFEREWEVTNLRRAIRGIHLFTEIQLEVLEQLEMIARAVSKIQKGTGRNIPVTVCGETAGIKAYQLHMRYMTDKYGIDITPSIPPVEIVETRVFMTHVDDRRLEAVFGKTDEKLRSRAEEEVQMVEDNIANLDRVKFMMLEEMEGIPEVKAEEVEAAIEAPEPEKELKVLSEAGKRHKRQTISLTVTGPLGVHARVAGRLVSEINRINEETGLEDALTVMIEAGSRIKRPGVGKVILDEPVRIIYVTDITDLWVGSGSELNICIEGPAAATGVFVRYLRGMTEEFEDRTVSIFRIRTEPPVEKTAEDFKVIVGIRQNIYAVLGEGRIEMLEKELGVRLIPVGSGDQESMIKELEKKIEGQ
ncbi:MAG: hypothetical protein DRP85_09800, partial [Candidatus Makaraimicrobium thalassicum]